MITQRLIEVLLVEDNPGDIRLTKEAFKECSVPVNLSYVMDGAEAILYLSKESPYLNVSTPDIILLDLNLPKKDGKQVLRFIKENPQLRSIPVIVLSTSNAENDILQVYDLHANCFITKPIDFNNFIEVVKATEHFWLKTVKLPSEKTLNR